MAQQRVLKKAKGRFFIWLGLLIFGVFEFMYGAMKLSYYDKVYKEPNYTPAPTDGQYYKLAFIGFFFSGIVKIVVSIPCFNSHKLLQLISFVGHFVMLVFAVAAMAGIATSKGFSDFQTPMKTFKFSGPILLFGSSLGFTVFYFGMFLHVKKAASS